MNDGGPAFPKPALVSDDGKNLYDSSNEGMSLLDYFAGQGLPALIQCVIVDGATNTAINALAEERNADPAALVAEMAYDYAGLMLVERAKRSKQD